MIPMNSILADYLKRTFMVVIPLSALAGLIYSWFFCGSVFTNTLFMSSMGCLIAVLSVVKNYRRFLKPITEMNTQVKAMSESNSVGRVAITGGQEILQLASTFNSFADTINRLVQNEAASSNNINQQMIHLDQSSRELNARFENVEIQAKGSSEITKEISHQLGKANLSVNNISADLKLVNQSTTVMVEALHRAQTGSSHSRENLNTVVTASEQMSSTVGEIAENSELARQTTANAVIGADSAQKSVDNLGVAASEINKIIDVIVEIAEQTKLLALNATIEAARAGEAGKGFAVVAGEVKELAKQTNDATADIRKKISSMQLSTENTIQEITRISGIINDVDQIVSSIASSVEEQSVTTKEISKNICTVANVVSDMSDQTKDADVEISNLKESISRMNSSVSAACSDIAIAVKGTSKAAGNNTEVLDAAQSMKQILMSMTERFNQISGNNSAKKTSASLFARR